MPLDDGLGIGCLGEILALFAEEDVIDGRLQAGAGGGRPLEGVAHELVQQGGKRDLGIGAHGIAERQGAVRSQLGNEPFGQRLDDVFLVVILRFGRLAADGDDGALNGAGCRDFGTGGFGLAVGVLDADPRLVLRAHIAAIDDGLAIAVDADEDAATRDVGRIVDDRALLEGFERRLDLAETLVDLVRQLIGFRVFSLDPFVFLTQASRAARSSSFRSTRVKSSARSP
jgi:hypothetical protein